MKTQIAKSNNYGEVRNLSAIKYIIIHYTGNDGDTDEANGNYFANNIVKASAHFFVDDDSITQSVPVDHVAWSVGGSKYSDCAQTGGGRLYKIAANSNSINIELCDTLKDGLIKATPQTIENAVVFVKELMAKYNIPAEHVIRHFDVNGKHCPAYWMSDSAWESEFHGKLTGSNATTTVQTSAGMYRIRKSWSDAKSQIGAYKNLEYAKVDCKDGYTVYDNDGNVVYTKGTQQTVASTPEPTPTPQPVKDESWKGDKNIYLENEYVKAWQHAMNVGFDLKGDNILAEDKKWGKKSQDFASTHTLWKGQSHYCPTAIKWLRKTLHDVYGFTKLETDNGKWTDYLDTCVGVFQHNRGLKEDKKVGLNTTYWLLSGVKK